MAVTQDSRYRMHQRLDEVLGAEPAATLMEHLPPTGWADLATKQDLAHVDEKLSVSIDQLDERLSARIDHVDQKLSARIDRLDEKWTERFDHQNATFTARFTAIEENMVTKKDLADLRSEFHRTLLTGVFAMMATNAGILGLALTLARGG